MISTLVFPKLHWADWQQSNWRGVKRFCRKLLHKNDWTGGMRKKKKRPRQDPKLQFYRLELLARPEATDWGHPAVQLWPHTKEAQSRALNRTRHFLSLFLHLPPQIILCCFPKSKIRPQMRGAGMQHRKHTSKPSTEPGLASVLGTASFLLQALPELQGRNAAETASLVTLFLFLVILFLFLVILFFFSCDILFLPLCNSNATSFVHTNYQNVCLCCLLSAL